MPNYLYRCGRCENSATLFLPISSDPGKLLTCGECGAEAMERRILNSSGFNGFRVWAGDWFQKEYGHDIAESDMSRVSKEKEAEAARVELAKENIRFDLKNGSD